VLEAHAARAEGRISEEELRRVEDEAILAALEMQRATGISVLSDGEYRRSTWAGDFVAAVEGYVPGEPPVTLRWRGQVGAPAAAPSTTGGRVIGERLRQVRRLTGHEAAFLAAHAGAPFKVTMPAPSYIVARGYKPGVTDKAYASRAELMADVSRIVAAEIKALVNEGVHYIQLDNPHYPDYLDAERREEWRAQGVDPDKALVEDVAGDNAALQGFDRGGVLLAMHICRGNGGQAGWHTEGSYEPIAEQVFDGIAVDRFLLEYDTERAGGFEPLRFVPSDKTVVLGLVTTKAGMLESEDELRRRIDEAARYVPLDRLALSPQCGFASVMQGNPLSWEEQKRKLELVVETAQRVWGA
jgi:5-methyltetrahydropteroyltriglutamate--homocysteine methyltransferase